MKKLLGTMTLLLSIALTSFTALANGNELEAPIQVGDTIAGMTVTQASIDDVDRLMAGMREAKTVYQMVTAQNSALFDITSEFCQRHEPELAQEVKTVTDTWLNRTNPIIYEKMNEQEKVEVVFNSQSRRQHITELKPQYLSMYLMLESNDSAKQNCSILIERLNTDDPNAFVDSVLKSYKDL